MKDLAGMNCSMGSSSFAAAHWGRCPSARQPKCVFLLKDRRVTEYV